MHYKPTASVFLLITFLGSIATAQQKAADVAYVKNGHARHVLDIYSPAQATNKSLPVMFWIHGGGWQNGDKSDVALKPKIFTERGMIFVSTKVPDLKR